MITFIINYGIVPLAFILGLIVQYFNMRSSTDYEGLNPSPYFIKLYSDYKNHGYVIYKNNELYKKVGQKDTFTLYDSYDSAYNVLEFLEKTENFKRTPRAQ